MGRKPRVGVGDKADGGKRLVGYIRVSTEEQARGGQSIDGQEREIRNWCAFHKHTLVELLADRGISGRKSIFKREQAARAMEMIRRGEAEGIIVWKLDRLGRDANELTQVAKRFQKSEWSLMSVTENLDTSNFMGRFFIQLLASLAEMESGRIGERVVMGMAELVPNSRVRSRATPFGWRMPDGKWLPRPRTKRDGERHDKADQRPMVEHPGEQVILVEIGKMESKGLSPYTIARQLNAKGMVNPRTRKPWLHTSIASIIKTRTGHDRILSRKTA